MHIRILGVALLMQLTAVTIGPAAAQEAAGALEVDAFFYNKNSDFGNMMLRDLKAVAQERNLKIDFAFGTGEFGQLEEYLNGKTEFKKPLIIHARRDDGAQLAAHLASRHDIPLIFLTSDPGDKTLQSYDKVWFIGSLPSQHGTFQARILIDYLKNHPEWDRNGNGELDFYLIKGDIGHIDTISRTRYVQQTLKRAKYKIHNREEGFANWNRQAATEIVHKMIAHYPLEGVDAIISNNDSMAMGVLDALHEQGYNSEDPKLFIPLVGVDGSPPAMEAIRKGQMLGTVIQDSATQMQVCVRLLEFLQQNPQGSPDESVLGVEVRPDRRIYIPYALLFQGDGQLQRVMEEQ